MAAKLDLILENIREDMAEFRNQPTRDPVSQASFSPKWPWHCPSCHRSAPLLPDAALWSSLRYQYRSVALSLNCHALVIKWLSVCFTWLLDGIFCAPPPFGLSKGPGLIPSASRGGDAVSRLLVPMPRPLLGLHANLLGSNIIRTRTRRVSTNRPILSESRAYWAVTSNTMTGREIVFHTTASRN